MSKRQSFRLTPPEMPEAVLHREIIAALAACLPTEAFLWHYPSGIFASPAAWQAMETLGAVAGFPDVGICLYSKLYLLEIKTGLGRESQAQRALARKIAAAGVPRAVVRGPGEALEQCRVWGLPVRRHWLHEPHPRPPLLLPEGFETVRLPWARRFQQAATAWRAVLAEHPPAEWLNTERLAAENVLRGLAGLAV